MNKPVGRDPSPRGSKQALSPRVSKLTISSRVSKQALSPRVSKLTISSRVSKLALSLERLNIAEYLALLQHPWRLFWLNLVAGLGRGIGYLLGLAIFGTVVVYLLQFLVSRNLPIIGNFIADFVELIQWHLQQ